MIAVISFSAEARSRLFPSFGTMFMGGLVLGAVAANKACHDAYGKLKSGCVSKEKSANPMDDPDSQVFLKSSQTKELRTSLNADLGADGLPPDPDDCDAHHIVPKNEGRDWAIKYADSAREVLNSCNISVDSANNGVYLPGKKHKKPNCTGSYHKTLHTEKYYREVAERLAAAQQNSCDAVLDELQSIKNDLIQGRY